MTATIMKVSVEKLAEMMAYKEEDKPKSLRSIHDENIQKYNTGNQTIEDFKIGDKVMVICPYEDGHFFWEETGVVIGITVEYGLAIKIRFDIPRVYKELDFELKEFSFQPVDLFKLN